MGGTDLIERDLGLGLKADLLRHPAFLRRVSVPGPALRQIQPIGHRQAGIGVGQRQRHRDLAVVLLAQLAAVLPRHADRMPALLGEARVVDDPGLDRPMPLDRRQNHLPHLRQHPLVRPPPLADKMQQRLMLGRRPLRRRHRRHRLHALALAGHQQPNAIIPQRLGSIGMADHAHKPFDISRKPAFAARSSKIHPSPRSPKMNLLKIPPFPHPNTVAF